MQNDNTQDQAGEVIENRICDHQLHDYLPFIELKMTGAQRCASVIVATAAPAAVTVGGIAF